MMALKYWQVMSMPECCGSIYRLQHIQHTLKANTHLSPSTISLGLLSYRPLHIQTLTNSTTNPNLDVLGTPITSPSSDQ
eukprot:Ihof_evm6s3 gene=Ihof_evmTU6s3